LLRFDDGIEESVKDICNKLGVNVRLELRGTGVTELLRLRAPVEKRSQLDQIFAQMCSSPDADLLASIETVCRAPIVGVNRERRLITCTCSADECELAAQRCLVRLAVKLPFSREKAVLAFASIYALAV
jgi:hypothetical protein